MLSELFSGVGKFKSRITLDIDSKKYFKIITTIEAILKLKNVVGFKCYSTKKGYHIIIYLNKKMTFKNQLIHRAYLGDDPLRIYYSKKEMPRQILFNRKIKYKHK